MKSRRTKACDIPMKVKKIVWERDKQSCILCGRRDALPSCHYIPRSQNGLGIEQNIVTLCWRCHQEYDNSAKRQRLKEYLKQYLQSKYKDWSEEDLVYRKGKNGL